VELIASRTFSIPDADITLLTFSLPRCRLCAQLAAALAECDRMVGLENVARQAFFISSEVNPAELTSVLEQVYGWPTPVTTYVHQPPAGDHAVSCELWAFSSQAPLQRTPHVSWVSTPSATWGFTGGMTTATGESPHEGTQRMLNGIQHELRHAGLDFAQTVRTWFYIGDILGVGEEGPRYGEFNAARNGFYRDKWPDLCLSPASTGIGTCADHVAFEGLLIKPEADAVQISWLDNSLQTPPFLYNTQPEQSKNPSFSRAAAVRLGDTVLTFISGTASIRCSQVIHRDDAVAQTEATIENIAALVGDDTLHNLQQLRVYIKCQEDVKPVRDYCLAHLPGVPCATLIGDVCVPGCLVEIEGVHVTSEVVAANCAPESAHERGMAAP